MNKSSFGKEKYVEHKIQIIADNHLSGAGKAVRSMEPSLEKLEKKKIAKWKAKAFETDFLGERLKIVNLIFTEILRFGPFLIGFWF